LPRTVPVKASTDQQTPQAATAPSNLFAGTSGWAYPTWKPGFYPTGVPARSFLSYYASQLTSVEVNYTFRTLPTEKQLTGWLDATPPNFRFSFKAPQRITHFQRLRESRATLTEFFSALEPARSAAKLGLLLFQLPPNFAADTDRLRSFLETAAEVASGEPLKFAFEFRHASWFTDATWDVLRLYNAALCVAHTGDAPGDLATPDIATADFRCYRLRQSGGYSSAELMNFARRFTALAAEGETYVYFRHEDDPAGALNAQSMLQHAAAFTGKAGAA
jgi:uncharacterized protein YecE (DUF72 family)